jgi:hypothetical protein
MQEEQEDERLLQQVRAGRRAGCSVKRSSTPIHLLRQPTHLLLSSTFSLHELAVSMSLACN